MNQHIAIPDNYTKADLPMIGQHNVPHSHRHHLRLHRVPSGGEEGGDEELDPRIQVELEKLNRASEDINRLEMELDDARTAFRQVLSESTQCLNALSRKLGSCVDKARPYYDARLRLKEVHLESQKAVLRFERSRRMHEAAREMVQLAEEGYKRREKDLDPTWQEMLNHATVKVNDAEKETLESEQHHHAITLVFKRREEEVQRLQKDLKKVITKSRPYFDMKEKFHQLLENHKRCVSRLENEVASAKSLYSQTLHNLEAISDSIHQNRLQQTLKLELGVREAGVGAEAPTPSPTCGKGMAVEGSLSSHGVYSEVDADLLDSGQTLASSKATGELRQSARSVSTVSCDPIYDTHRCIHDVNFRGEHIKGCELNAAELNTVLSDLKNVPCLFKRPQTCLPDSVCRSESKNSTCQDGLGLRNYQIEGLANKAASAGAGKSCCSNSQATVSLSQACGCHSQACHDPLISETLRMHSSVSESLKHEIAEPICHCGHQYAISQEQKCLHSKDTTDMPSSFLPVSPNHPSKVSSPLEKPSNLLVDSHKFSSQSLSIQGVVKLPSQTQPQLPVELAAGMPRGMIIGDALLQSSPQDRMASPRSSHVLQTSPPLPQKRRVSPDSSSHVTQTLPSLTDSPACSSSIDPSIRSQPLPISSTASRSASSQYEVTCMRSSPEECSSLPASSGCHTKASKLQGIILQVDTAGILSVGPSVYKSADPEKSPKVIISTHHPTLGVFIEKSPQSHFSQSL